MEGTIAASVNDEVIYIFDSDDEEENDVLEYDDLSDSVLATIMPSGKTAVKIYKIKKLKNSLNLSK